MTEPLFLLDANICIYLLKGDVPGLRARVETWEPGQIVTSAISYGEVMIGVRKRDAVEEAERFFKAFPVLPFDADAAKIYSDLPFKRADFDRLVAAHALALGLTVITNNERHFVDVPNLRVENWML